MSKKKNTLKKECVTWIVGLNLEPMEGIEKSVNVTTT